MFEQQGGSAVELAKRQKKKNDGAAASSSNSRPPPPPPDDRKAKKANQKPAPVVLPITNSVQNTPSQQPSGAQVPGPRGAVMPNTGAAVPANPPPVTTNTREDDKPLKKSMREGADPAVRTKIQKQSAVDKEKRRQAKVKAQRKQDKEAKNATAPLGDSDDKPLVPPKNKPPAAKAKAKGKAVTKDDSDDDKPLVEPKNKPPKAKAKAAQTDDSDDKPLVRRTPAAKAKPKAKSAIEKERTRQRASKRKEREVAIQKTPLPKAKKRAKNAPASQKEEDAKNILRAAKKASVEATCSKKIEKFVIADPPEPEKRKAAANIPNPRMPKNLRAR